MNIGVHRIVTPRDVFPFKLEDKPIQNSLGHVLPDVHVWIRSIFSRVNRAIRSHHREESHIPSDGQQRTGTRDIVHTARDLREMCFCRYQRRVPFIAMFFLWQWCGYCPGPPWGMFLQISASCTFHGNVLSVPVVRAHRRYTFYTLQCSLSLHLESLSVSLSLNIYTYI